MKKIIAIACMALLAGCQQAEEIENESEELQISIEASIGESEIVSGRYAGSEPNDVAFTTSDDIGVSVNGGDFVRWSYDGTSWKTDANGGVYWDDKTSSHTFHAFYPYDEISSERIIPMPDLTAQDGTMESLAECDFLVATKTQDYGTNGVVSFTEAHSFEHVSSLVKITLKGEGDLASASIKKITLSGQDISTLSTYSFEGNNAGVTLNKEDDNGDSLDLTMSCNMNSEDQTFYCIINAGTVDMSSMKMFIEYTSSSGTAYKAELSGMGDKGAKFESGKQYSYTLKVADGVLTITGGSITEWEDGANMEDIIINGVEQNKSEDEDA